MHSAVVRDGEIIDTCILDGYCEKCDLIRHLVPPKLEDQR